jgi:CheY-like chemotaxis protein
MADPVSLLLVDDAFDLAAVVQSLARRAGWSARHCPDAESAWNFLTQHEPDLVLLDVRLPGMSGPELCKRLHAAGRDERLRIALFTHFGVPADVAAGLLAGAQFLVGKDLVCDPPVWQARVLEILGEPRGRRPLPPLTWRADSDPRARPDCPDREAVLSLLRRHPAVRHLPLEVRRAVLRRALGRVANWPPARNDAIADWLLHGDPAAPPPEFDRPTWPLLLDVLADEWLCVLGGPPSASLRAALIPLAPGLTEGPSSP